VQRADAAQRLINPQSGGGPSGRHDTRLSGIARREQRTTNHVSQFALGAGDLQRIVTQRRHRRRGGDKYQAGDRHQDEGHEALNEQLSAAHPPALVSGQ
jgi:hypothetical protein